MQLQAQYAFIGCGQNLTTPAFRVRAVTHIGLTGAGFDASSSQTLTAQAADVLGQGASSGSFRAIQKADLSGAWSLTVTGAFAVNVGGQLAGFDEVRFFASSVSNAVRTLAMFTKI